VDWIRGFEDAIELVVIELDHAENKDNAEGANGVPT